MVGAMSGVYIQALLTALRVALFGCGWYTFGLTSALIWAIPAVIVYGILIILCTEWDRNRAMAYYRHDQEEQFRRRQQERWEAEDKRWAQEDQRRLRRKLRDDDY